MKRLISLCFLLLTSIFVVAACAAAAPAPASAAVMPFPYLGLTVAAENGVRQLAPNNGVFEYGEFSALDRPRLEHVFLLRNDSKAPLKIEQLQSSCNCTNAQIVPLSGDPILSAAVDPTPVLQPGQLAAVKMTVSVPIHETGSFSKAVFVYIHGADRYAAMLQITGILKPVIGFSPDVLKFGQVPLHQRRSVTMRITVDTRLAPAGALPPLVSSNPAIHIRSAQMFIDRSRALLTKNYILTFCPQRLGPLYGGISLDTSQIPKNRAISESDVRDAFSNIEAMAMGDGVAGQRSTHKVSPSNYITKGTNTGKD